MVVSVEVERDQRTGPQPEERSTFNVQRSTQVQPFLFSLRRLCYCKLLLLRTIMNVSQIYITTQTFQHTRTLQASITVIVMIVILGPPQDELWKPKRDWIGSRVAYNPSLTIVVCLTAFWYVFHFISRKFLIHFSRFNGREGTPAPRTHPAHHYQ